MTKHLNKKISLVYNKIASDYNLKRFRPWKPLSSFLNTLKEEDYLFNGYIIDLGCANGRHFKELSFSSVKLIGIDNSLRFLKIAKRLLSDTSTFSRMDSKNIDLIQSDVNFIPMRFRSIDSIFSIATIHHIKKNSLRIDFFNQIFEILKSNGYIFFTVWRKWQKKYRKFFIYDWIKRKISSYYKKEQKNIDLREFGDKFVPWTVSSEGQTYNRFYHFFSKREIKKLLRKFRIIKCAKMGGPYNKDNFFVFAQKKE